MAVFKGLEKIADRLGAGRVGVHQADVVHEERQWAYKWILGGIEVVGEPDRDWPLLRQTGDRVQSDGHSALAAGTGILAVQLVVDIAKENLIVHPGGSARENNVVAQNVPGDIR